MILYPEPAVEFCDLVQFDTISWLQEEPEDQAHCGSCFVVGSHSFRSYGLLLKIKIDCDSGILMKSFVNERIALQFSDFFVEQSQSF